MSRASGPGEMSHLEATVPPSVKQGGRGGVEQADGQTDIMESGLKGGAGETPAANAAAGTINQPMTKAVQSDKLEW